MEHILNMTKDSLVQIQKGRKNIELSLYDEKCQRIQAGDVIAFKLAGSQECAIKAKVSAGYRADSFSQLFKSISMYDCGFDAKTDIYRAVSEMRKHCSEEQERQFGVVGIELSKIYWKADYHLENYPVLKYRPSENWKRMINSDINAKEFFTITTDSYIVRISGGSVKFYYKENDVLIKSVKGFKYLYTGDVNVSETEMMALENGKHFYILSLKDFTQTKRVTLPRGYESIDVCGKYSKDGKVLCIPVSKYIDEKERYGYWLCQYETENYTMLKMESISREEKDGWSWVEDSDELY